MALIQVPIELRENFIRDPENFLRDIAAIPLEAVRPFFKRRDMIQTAIDKSLTNPFDEETLQFDRDFDNTHKKADNFPRYMHIDLGIRHDAVGISMCHCPYFVESEVNRHTRDGIEKEVIHEPIVKFDFIGRIKVSKGEEIILSEIRDIIFEISRRGFYIGLITFDQFQSVDSIQLLKREGYRTGRLSIDRTSHKLIIDKHAPEGIRRESVEGRKIAAMQSLKDALYDGRLKLPYHSFWEKEAMGAEYDEKKMKVDHPPQGTIDMLQSLAGSCFNLTNNEFKFIEESDAEYFDKFQDNYYNKIEDSNTNITDSYEDSFYDDIRRTE